MSTTQKTWTLAEQQELVNNLAKVFGWSPVPVLSWPEDKPAAPFLEIRGVKYVESPGTVGCAGCAFISGCGPEIWHKAEDAFGNDCFGCGCIYIKRGVA